MSIVLFIRYIIKHRSHVCLSYTVPLGAGLTRRWLLGLGETAGEGRREGSGLGVETGGSSVEAGDTLWYEDTLSATQHRDG